MLIPPPSLAAGGFGAEGGLVWGGGSGHGHTPACPWHLPAAVVGAAAGGRSNLGWEREDVSLMIAFDFVILAVIALSRSLKDSAWKCSQIITIIQKEGKIVFLPVQTESTIKNTPVPPRTFLCIWLAPGNPLQSLRGQAGDSPTARSCWCVLGGISVTVICSGRKGRPGATSLLADAPTVGNDHQGLMWRGGDRRNRREGSVMSCLAFVCCVAGVGWALVAGSHPIGSCVPHAPARLSSQGPSCSRRSLAQER